VNYITAYFLLNRSVDFGDTKEGKKTTTKEYLIIGFIIVVTFAISGGFVEILASNGISGGTGIVIGILFGLLVGVAIGGGILLFFGKSLRE